MFNVKRASIHGGIALFGLLGLASCAKEEESVIVRNAVAPEEQDDGSCLIDPGAPAVVKSTVDLSFDTGYALGLVVLNNLAEVDSSNTKIDDSEMFVESADVRLDIPQDPSLIDGIEDSDSSLVEFNQVVVSNSFTSQEEMGVVVEIPRASLEAVGDAVSGAYGDDPDTEVTMTASVILHVIRAANTLPGGVGDVESREFTVPINVCFGCLRDCAACGYGTAACEVADVGDGLCGNAQDVATQPFGCTGA